MKSAFLLFALVHATLATPIEENANLEFTSGNHKFAAYLHKELIKVQGGNIVTSPFSAQTVLALTHEGAKGESAREMVSGLSLPSTNKKIQEAFKWFLPKLTSSDENLKLSTANKIYVGKGVKLEDDFRQVAESVYESGIENVNFEENEETAGKINSWVEERSESRIKEIIDPSSIDSDTTMVLVNALYFKGIWLQPFASYRTQKKKFYASEDKVVEVDMMHQVEYLKYYENTELGAKFLEKPYRGGNVSMVFILPNENQGLAALEKNMKVLLAPQPLQVKRVDVLIPKFRIETKIEMIPLLRKLGINKIFNRGEADLSGLSSTDKNLVVSDVIQKVFIDVNEAGTEAAAASAVIVEPLSLQRPPKLFFIANRPFAFYIQSNGIIIFIGRYTG
nr:alaserpin-like isoform X1 [Leptinotarsa decemlineata]XP_023014557.1 alaserpin-like isoform X1 [Leptinotarsa decemlineata]